ncbi:MAG: asparagine synthase-related protein [Odoribacter sp.]
MMFIGNFTNEPIVADDKMHYTHWHGMLIDGDVVCYETEHLAVAFWGEIYNKVNLKIEQLTNNNAQTIAVLFELKNMEGFKLLDGSFSFILKTDDQTMIVRDHHGIGPQVYYSSTHFCSHLDELILMCDCPMQINKRGLGTFLEIGYIPTPNSALEGISKLGAGQMLWFVNDNLRTIKLYTNSSNVNKSIVPDLDDLSKQYGLLHQQAILRRIGNSRNVGVLLSGGYDSGANLAALRQVYDGKISSYSIGFKGNNWSELPLAQCMSDRFGTDHHYYEIDGSEIRNLPRIVDWLGDPFVEGGVMVNFAAMELVGTDRPDVILGGDGSDQYFGTSAREVAIRYLASKYGIEPLLVTIHKQLSRPMFDKNNIAYRVRFQLSKILNILNGDMFGFEPFILKRLLKYPEKSMPTELTDRVDLSSFENLYEQHASETDIERTIDQVILFKASQMASMFDNHIVFPYMDLELYNFLQKLPINYKCNSDNVWQIARGQSTAKFLLKYHYKPLLPAEITTKKKQGGFAPMPIFFKDKSQRNILADFIMQSSVVSKFLNRNSVEKFIKTYDRESSDNGNWFWYKQNKAIQYFNLLTFAIWWEQYVEGRQKVNL